MAREPRNFVQHNYYHVIARGNNKMSLFRSKQDFYFYKNCLLEVKAKETILIHHYVLMPNHVHMVVNNNEADLSMFMKLVQQRYAKYYHRNYNFVGHVWQGRFKSLIMESDEYLIACGKYVEMNPVRAGLVVDPKNWSYSSYRYYASGENDVLVDEVPFFKSGGYSIEQNRENYRKEFLLGTHMVPGTVPGTK